MSQCDQHTPTSQTLLNLLFIFFISCTTLHRVSAQPDCNTFSFACSACTANDHCVYCNQSTSASPPSKCVAYLGATSVCQSPVIYQSDCRPCETRLSCADCLTSASTAMSPSSPSNAAQCSWCSSASAAGDGGLCVPARASCNRSPFFLRTDQFASCARFVPTVPVVSSTALDDSAIDAEPSTVSPAPSPDSLIDQPAIVGASVAALVLIVLIVVLAVYLVVRFRRLRATQRKTTRPADDSLAVRNAAYDSDLQIDHRGAPVRVVSARRIEPVAYDNPFSTSKHIEQAPPSDRLFSPPLHMTTNVLPSPYSFERRLPNGDAMYDAVPPVDDF